MDGIMKIGVLGIVAVLTGVQLKAQKPEYSIYMGSALAILIFAYALDAFENVLVFFHTVKTYLGNSGSYLVILLRVIGITYVCEFSAGICKDAGYGSIAEQIQIVGKLAVMFAGTPVLYAVIEQLRSFGA